jgi:hypothetical protein
VKTNAPKFSKPSFHNLHIVQQQPQLPQQPQSPKQPQTYGDERRKRDHSNDQCFFCNLKGHRIVDFPDYEHLQALQRKKRQEKPTKMQQGAFMQHHHHQMQGLREGYSPHAL